MHDLEVLQKLINPGKKLDVRQYLNPVNPEIENTAVKNKLEADEVLKKHKERKSNAIHASIHPNDTTGQ